jgi:ABC-2 type transport system permease protein
VAEGVVYDLGYQPHQGEQLGRAGALRALYRDGLRRVLGLRRRARAKAIPWTLLGIAVIPAIFFIGLAVFTREIGAEDVSFFSHAQYFDLTGTIALLFIAAAAGELLVPDRVHGVLHVYASRPLTTLDYLAGRAAALAVVVFSFMYLPHLVLFFGRAWTSGDGFGSYVASHAGVLWQAALASLVYFLALAPPAFLFAAYSKRLTLGAGAFIGVMAVSTPVSDALAEVGFEPAGLLALQQHPVVVKDWILGVRSGHLVPQQAGFDSWVSLTAIVIIALLTGALVARRYRSPL